MPVEQAYHQQASFPDAEIVILEDSGHWLYLDDPERAALAIVPFLKTQLTAADGAESPG